MFNFNEVKATSAPIQLTQRGWRIILFFSFSNTGHSNVPEIADLSVHLYVLEGHSQVCECTTLFWTYLKPQLMVSKQCFFSIINTRSLKGSFNFLS